MMFNYVQLQLRALFRNKRYLIFTVGFPLIFFIAITASLSGADAKSYAIGYMVSMAVYGSTSGILGSTGPAIANERKTGWLRQLRLFPISDGAIFGGKLMTAMATSLPSLVLVALAGRIFKGIDLSAPQWIEMVLFMWIATIPFAALGVLIGYVFEGETARMISILLGVLLAFLGGLWFPLDAMKGGFRHIATAMPTYRIYELGHNVVTKHSFNINGVLILAIYAVVFSALAVLRIRRAGGVTA